MADAKRRMRQQYVTAAEISAALASSPCPAPDLTTLEDALQSCRRWQLRSEKARVRGWTAGRLDSIDRLRSAVDLLRQRVEMITSGLGRPNREMVAISIAELYREIESLRCEFDSVAIERSTKRLRVRTDEIVLEGIYLGRFDMVLRWDRIKESQPYDVMAVDSGCGTRDGTSHPHVQNDKLCEGEGATVIKRALREGRLFDFFTVVNRILNTYNPHSAYVSLDDWEGVSCRSCGDTVDPDYLYRCVKCETELCGDCSDTCESCSDRFCSDCMNSCAGCETDCCHYCRKPCDECDDHFCDSCLTEGLCDDCIDRKDQTPDEDSSIQTQQPCA